MSTTKEDVVETNQYFSLAVAGWTLAWGVKRPAPSDARGSPDCYSAVQTDAQQPKKLLFAYNREF